MRQLMADTTQLDKFQPLENNFMRLVRTCSRLCKEVVLPSFNLISGVCRYLGHLIREAMANTTFNDILSNLSRTEAVYVKDFKMKRKPEVD
jgi:hypothetical protein